MTNVTKKFTVVNSISQTKKVFDTDMTTVDELTAKLKSLGMDLTNTVIQESLSKTTLQAGKLLPHDVMYKGETTNNLVFRITLSGKKTDSGADRQGLISTIKANNWGQEIKNVFGKNFTNCKTVDLESFVNSKFKGNDKKTASAKKAYVAPVTKVTSKAKVAVKESTEVESNVEVDTDAAIAVLANILESNGYISAEEKSLVFSHLSTPNATGECYSAEELEEILG